MLYLFKELIQSKNCLYGNNLIEYSNSILLKQKRITIIFNLIIYRLD